MNVDLSKLVTAEDKVALAAQERAQGIKAEVARRILAVVDEYTQASLLAAMVAGLMPAEERATFKLGQAWIEATKQAGRLAVESGADPVWPEVPEGVAELAALY